MSRQLTSCAAGTTTGLQEESGDRSSDCFTFSAEDRKGERSHSLCTSITARMSEPGSLVVLELIERMFLEGPRRCAYSMIDKADLRIGRRPRFKGLSM